MTKFTLEQIDELNTKLKTPQEVLKWALDNLHPKLALASSFGAEDVVVIDMLMKINPKARVFTLDTGRLNQETYDVMDAIRKKYNINIEVTFPDAQEVIEMVRVNGMNLFYESPGNRKLCCGIRKVHPLNKMLETLDGWITGLRSDQTQNRSTSKKIEIDDQHNGMIKINPILDWTWEQTWNYIKVNNIPYNKLHDKGYPSIGCEPCTRAIKPGEDLRAGRWWWENQSDKECGLHMDHGKQTLAKSNGIAKPLGGKLVNRITTKNTSGLYSFSVSEDVANDIENIADGIFSPLEGFLGQNDFENVISHGRLANGIPWTIPIVLDVDNSTGKKLKDAADVLLKNPQGNGFAILHVEELYSFDKEKTANKVYGTLDTKHPGVAKTMAMNDSLVGGTIDYIKRPDEGFIRKYRKTPTGLATGGLLLIDPILS